LEDIITIGTDKGKCILFGIYSSGDKLSLKKLIDLNIDQVITHLK